MLTQILLISSDSVLDAALSKPAISNLPMIRSSTDPKALLRRELQVDIVAANTYLIRVMMSCADPNEGAAIVNSVVDAYMDQHGKYHAAANRSLCMAIETEIAKYDHRIADIQDRLMNPIRHGLIAQPPGLSGATKEDSESIRPSLSPNTEQQYARVADRILQADLDLIDAQVRLETARLPRSGASTEKMREVETAVEEAKQRRNSYAKYLSQMKVATGSSDGESFPATVVKHELAGLTKIRDSLKLKLAQLEFEIGQEAYRISVQDKACRAESPRELTTGSMYMAVTPVVVLLLVFGLALLQEIACRRRDLTVKPHRGDHRRRDASPMMSGRATMARPTEASRHGRMGLGSFRLRP